MTIYSSYHRRTGRGGSGGDDLGGGFFVQTGGRKHNTNTSSNSNKRRKMLAALYGSLGLLAVYTNVFDMRLPTSLAALRRQLSGCISNVYATESEVLNLPPVPAQGSTYLPSYIKLCYEWMRREAAPNVAYTNLNVLENKDICVDWTAPHYAMMEIVASQILSTAIPVSGISYQHKCAEFRSNDEGLLGFDWTPFQTIYQEAAMGVDAQAIFKNGIDDLRTTCKAALQAYNSTLDKLRVRSRAAHHPFAFPTRSIMDGGLILDPAPTRTELLWLPAVPDISNPRLAPISAVYRQLHNRFHTNAENWVGVTNPPPNEKHAGVVIMVDNASREMDPAILNEYIPAQVTSISILASPLCVTSTLATGTPCLDYVDQLLNYFDAAYPTLAGNGPDGGAGVTSKIVPSTAAGLARPMTANTLLCPPNTLSCLPAALGKVPQPIPTDPPIPNPPLPSTVLFDVPESVAAASFVDKIGRCGHNPLEPETCIKVIQLADPEVAPTTEGTVSAPDPVPVGETTSGEPVAESFNQAQDPVDYDGFDVSDPSYSDPGPTPDPEATAEITPYESFTNATEDMPTEVEQSVNLDPFASTSPLGAAGDGTTEQPPAEKTVTDEEITNAENTGEPINTNTPVLSEGELAGLTAEESTGELVSEETTTPLETSFLDTITYNDLIAERTLSQGRIADANYVSSDPQIYCPTETSTGNVQDIDGGYTLSDDGTTVVVSDTNGIVTFQSPVTITTLTPQVGEFVDPDTLEPYTDEYITVFDAVLQDYVNVTDSVISSSGGNIVVDHSIGSLYVDPTNNQGHLLLDGAAVDLSDASDTHTLIEGTVIGVGAASVPLTPQGTTTMTQEGGLETTGEDDPNSYTTTTDPAEQPMAPENTYQLPSDTNSDSYVTRQLHSYDQCATTIDTNPIHIRSHSTDGSGVTSINFDVAQVYKAADTISWVAVDIPVDPAAPTTSDGACRKVNGISHGFDTRMADFNAQCDANGQLVVDVHIHDGSKGISQSDIEKCSCPRKVYRADPQQCIDDYSCVADRTNMVPDRCEPSQDIFANNKCHFRYVVDCNALPTARRRLQSIGPAPPAIVTPVPTEKGRVLVQEEGEPLFGGSNVFKECIHRRTKRADGKVIFNNFKFGNGIQNAGLIVDGANGNERGLRGPVWNHNLEVINV